MHICIICCIRSGSSSPPIGAILFRIISIRLPHWPIIPLALPIPIPILIGPPSGAPRSEACLSGSSWLQQCIAFSIGCRRLRGRFPEHRAAMVPRQINDARRTPPGRGAREHNRSQERIRFQRHVILVLGMGATIPVSPVMLRA